MLPVDPKQVEYWKEYWKRKAQEEGYDVDCLIDHLRPIYKEVIYENAEVTLDKRQELIICMRLCRRSRTEIRGLLGITNDKTFREHISRTSSYALKELAQRNKSNTILDKPKRVTQENFTEIVKAAGYYDNPEQDKSVNLAIVDSTLKEMVRNEEITETQKTAIIDKIIKACE